MVREQVHDAPTEATQSAGAMLENFKNDLRINAYVVVNDDVTKPGHPLQVLQVRSHHQLSVEPGYPVQVRLKQKSNIHVTSRSSPTRQAATTSN